jgi:hypothetical protein
VGFSVEPRCVEQLPVVAERLLPVLLLLPS